MTQLTRHCRAIEESLACASSPIPVIPSSLASSCVGFRLRCAKTIPASAHRSPPKPSWVPGPSIPLVRLPELGNLIDLSGCLRNQTAILVAARTWLRLCDKVRDW